MADRNDSTGPKTSPLEPRPADQPHDENYTPGYHEGGSRFGFFNGNDNAGAPTPAPAGDDKAPKTP